MGIPEKNADNAQLQNHWGHIKDYFFFFFKIDINKQTHVKKQFLTKFFSNDAIDF